MYPTPYEQQDFMCGKMRPNIQKVLTEITDLVTTAPKRAYIEQYTMDPATDALTSTSQRTDI
jgi:hypothetical protein